MSLKKRPKPARGKAFGILNPYGDLWTYEHFATEEAARKYIKDFWSQAGFGRVRTDLGSFKVIPVRVRVSAIPPRVGQRGSAGRDGATTRHMLSVQEEPLSSNPPPKEGEKP